MGALRAAAWVLLLSATAAWGLASLELVTQWPLARRMRPRLHAPVAPGRQRRAAALQMAAASQDGPGSQSEVTRAVRLRPALVGGGGALALVLGSRLPGMLPILLPLLSVLLPAWSAIRLWRDGKRRAAITLACSAAARRFCTRWWQYCTIPLFAGAVGWLTNKASTAAFSSPQPDLGPLAEHLSPSACEGGGRCSLRGRTLSLPCTVFRQLCLDVACARRLHRLSPCPFLKVAVDMIFYPVEFGGLRIRTYPNQPLGFIGWQVWACPSLAPPPA
jgi:hypothetical protein